MHIDFKQMSKTAILDQFSFFCSWQCLTLASLSSEK